MHLRAYGCDADLEYRWTLTRGDGLEVATALGRVTQVAIAEGGDFRVHLDVQRDGESVGSGLDLNTTVITVGFNDNWEVPATRSDEDLVLPLTCCPSRILFGFAHSVGPVLPGEVYKAAGLADNFAVVDAEGRVLATSDRWIDLHWPGEGPVPDWGRAGGGDWRLRVLRHDGLGGTAGSGFFAAVQVSYDDQSEERWADLADGTD